ncbi:MAG: radical SAM protein [Gammaproteobacteria bacterium]
MPPPLPEQLICNWHLMEPCNFHCEYCYAKFGKLRKAIYMDPHLSEMLLDEIKKLGENKKMPVRVVLSGGEPLQDKNIGGKVGYAHGLGMDVSVITNASVNFGKFVEECASQMQWLVVSIDSIDAETNLKIGRYGGSVKSGARKNLLDHESVAQNLRRARELNPNLRIKINTVLNRHNLHDAALPKFVHDLLDPDKDKWNILRVQPNAASEAPTISDREHRDFRAQYGNLPYIAFRGDGRPRSKHYITDDYMIDPYGRFLFNNYDDVRFRYSLPILEAGIVSAWENRQCPK